MATSTISTCFASPKMKPCSFVDQLLQNASAILDSPPLSSFSFDTIAKSFPRDGHLTPTALTSLLLGVASSLMVVGSVIFMVGAMMMPLVACFGTVACFGSILPSFSFPWLWRGRGYL